MVQGEFSSLVITVLLGCMLVVGIGLMLGDVKDNYAVNVENASVFDQSQQISSLVGQINNKTQSTRASDTNVVGVILDGAVGALQLTLGSVNILQSLVVSFGETLGVPSAFTTILVTIIGAILVFAFFSAVLKFNL